MKYGSYIGKGYKYGLFCNPSCVSFAIKETIEDMIKEDGQKLLEKMTWK